MGYFKKLDQEIKERTGKDEDQKKYYIETQLGVEFADQGPWRSYEIFSEGDTISELFDNAHISEIDQDGGELNDYPIGEASNKIIGAAILLFEQTTGMMLCDNHDSNGGCAGSGECESYTYQHYDGICEACADVKAEKMRLEADRAEAYLEDMGDAKRRGE